VGTDVVLTFVVLPAAIVLVISALAYAGGRAHQDRRYRPGRPYEFTPVWYLARPRPEETRGARELPAGPHRPGLPATTAPAGAGATQGSTGGASDRW
jgi:hypothetical protein